MSIRCSFKKKKLHMLINVCNAFQVLFHYLLRASFVFVYILLHWNKSPGGVTFTNTSPIT